MDPPFTTDLTHPILPDPLWPGHIKALQPTAGTDVTDQIGDSVANSANEGSDPNPSLKRDIIGNNPKSFVPDYETTSVKSAGDIAEAESKAKGDAIKAKETAAAAKKAAKKAKAEAERVELDKKNLADALSKPAKTMKEKEE